PSVDSAGARKPSPHYPRGGEQESDGNRVPGLRKSGRLSASRYSEAARLAKTGPDALAHPKVARALEEALVHAMIQCLTEGTVIKTDSAKRHHTAIIAKLEEFLAANGTHPLYLTEICTATGVSESTLRRCCYEHLGMGPVRYLWLRRMHLARLALL